MMHFAIIGIGAGAAASLLFASVTSGTVLSIPLFYLAPLPIMIAGLGWGHWAALIATLTGAVAIGIIFGTVFLFAFLAVAGAPAWWLSYLAMLARPAAASSGNGRADAGLEWYPPGHLVVWAAGLAALSVIVAIPNFGTDAETFRAGMRSSLDAVLHLDPEASKGDRILNFLVTAIPPAAAVVATITSLLNLWLAASVVKFSGRLARPFPQLSAMTFPPMLAAVLALAIGLSFSEGMLGIVAGVAIASLLLAYGVLGFAVLHAITDGMNMRWLVLGLAYAAVTLIGWPLLVLCLLGLADSVIGVRGRFARKGGPLPPSST
jgi:hypothetical protein